MSILRPAVLALVILAIAAAAFANPADPAAIRILQQPDGSAIRARLVGDAWMHRYETLDGHAIVRDEAGFWVHALAAPDGGLVPSSVAVGTGAPPVPAGVRPAGAALAELQAAGSAGRGAADIRGITGTQELVIILVEFADTGADEGSLGPHDVDYFAAPDTGLVLGGNQGRLRHYYDEVSYGQLDLQGAVAGGAWLQSARTELYYGQDCSPGVCPPATSDNCNVCISELVREAVLLADTAGVDFAPYDTDGDGVVDHVLVVHAGGNQGALAGGPDDIWSHRGSIPGGQAVDGKTVQGYMLLSEHDAMSVFAQEFAHDLGAPDLWDHDGDSEPVGEWCLMGAAWETASPPHLCGLLKIDIDGDLDNGLTGWAVAGLLTDEGGYVLDRLDQNQIQGVLMTEPSFSGGERFLVENRQADGFYESSLPESGLLFTHIDMAMPDGGGLFNDGPPTNSYHGAWIERPGHLPSAAGAAWSADDGETRFGPATIPDTDANGGHGTGYVFRDIGPEAGAMSFTFQPQPTNVSGPITSDVTWTLGGSPYIVTASITVEDGVRLTIEPGVIVKFNSGTAMTINGVLIAEGAPADSIVFTSYRDDQHGGDTNGDGPSAGTPGNWDRLFFDNPNNGCSLDYCLVRYAGYGSPYEAVRLIGTEAELSMSHSTVEWTYGYGFYTDAGTSLTLADCMIRHGGYDGIYAAGAIAADNCTSRENGQYGFRITSDGVVLADCRASENASHGMWLTGEGCAITSNTLDQNGGTGLLCEKAPVAFSGNLSSDNAGLGYEIPVEVLAATWQDNIIGINGRGGAIGVRGGTVQQSETWTGDHPLYFSYGSVSVPEGVTLTISPGAILRLNESFVMSIYGALLAEGTEADSIVFTSYRDDQYGGDCNGDQLSAGEPGDWYYIQFNESAFSNCSMSHCLVRYAGRRYGYSYYNSSILVYTINSVSISNSIIEYTDRYSSRSYNLWIYPDGVLTLSDCIIRDNEGYGVFCQGQLDATRCQITGNGGYGLYGTGDGIDVSNCRLSENGDAGLWLTGGNCAVVADTLDANGGHGLYCEKLPSAFHDNVSAGNGGFGYAVPAGVIADVWNHNTAGVNGRDGALGVTGGTVAASTQWNDDQPYAVLADVTVGDGATLNLEPGAILKFDTDRSMTVTGTLVASGAVGDSIVFTAYADDAHGGDTNGDEESAGAPGDWRHIHFSSPDAGSALSFCIVRYAGRRYYISSQYRESAIRLTGSGAELSVSNSLIDRNGDPAYDSGPYSGAVFTESGSHLTMSQCFVDNNYTAGIHCDGSLDLADSWLHENEGDGVRVTGADGSVTDCAFEGNTGTGLHWTSLPAAFSGNAGQDNGGFNFAVRAEALHQVWTQNTSGPNARGNAVGITGGTVLADVTWIDDHPYAVLGNLDVPAGVALTLEPGAIFKFDRYYGLAVNGVLLAEGGMGDPIVFSSYADDAHGGDTNGDEASDGVPGDWSGIEFVDPGFGCSLRHCVIRYAGYSSHTSYPREALHLEGAGAALDLANCVVERTGGGGSYPYAVRGYAGTTLQLSACAIRDNDGTGLLADGGLGLWDTEISGNGGDGASIRVASSVVSGCLAASNAGYGFHVHPELAGEIARDDSLAGNGHANSIGATGGTITADDEWPGAYPMVATGDIVVDSTVTLLVQPGSVVKFDGSFGLDVQGTLVAQGDAVDKVVFTSYRDDAYGGDGNEDGINSLPAAGDWTGIRFDNAGASSRLGRTVVSYAGGGGQPAVEIAGCDLVFDDCVVIHNQDRGIRVDAAGGLTIHTSDIYDNGFGLENLNAAAPVDATYCYWGSATGPYHAVENPGGLGDPVSDHVVVYPWLDSSVDNPWLPLASPAPSGNTTCVLGLHLDSDSDPYLDLLAGTEANGLHIWSRTGFESWQTEASPITTGQVLGLDRADFNGDGHEDFLACGSFGIRVFACDGAGSLTETPAPLGGESCSDAHFAYIDHDVHIDIVGCSADNNGLYVFHGDGAGNWTPGPAPAAANSFYRVACADLDGDTWLDIAATSAEYHGVRAWIGSAAGDWTPLPALDDGRAFYGLDLGDIDKDGDWDLVVGAIQTGVGIRVFLNDGAANWSEGTAPTSSGLYKDLLLRDVNGDAEGRLDLLAASQGGGVSVWTGTESLVWNFWYHPASSGIYNGICVDDWSLDGTWDLAGAATFDGVSLWQNLTPGSQNPVFVTDPGELPFNQVAIGACAHDDFTLQNASADTLYNVVVYATSPEFDVAVSPGGREVGPFTMLPLESLLLRVTYCPVDEGADIEAVVIHSTAEVTSVRLTGEGVTLIPPLWTADLIVANGTGGEGNSQTLSFGAGIGATDGLDPQSGEVGLPPLPPSTVFDARWQVPGCEGTLLNIHDHYNVTDAFTFQWQEGSGAYPMTASWDPETLPAGTFLIGTALKDTLDMAAHTQYVVPVGMEYITELTVWTNVHSTFCHDLHDSWQMVSLPVVTDDDSLSALFPGAVSAFGFAGGYVQAHTLDPGSGYWLDMPEDGQICQVGEQVRLVELDLPAGWSLVGAPFASFAVADLYQDPPGCLQSVFGFGLGYELADTLQPGQGYWFDLSESCRITMDLDAPRSAPTAGGPMIAGRGEVIPGEASTGAWRMTLHAEPTAGAAVQLTIGTAAGAGDGIDAELGERELPPWPPARCFDTRLALSGSNGLRDDLRDPAGTTHRFQLRWQAPAACFPLVIRWDPGALPSGEARLVDALDGSLLGPVDMHAADRVEIPGTLAHLGGVDLLVTDADASPGVPSVLALHQNVPNPFNPVTVIHFDLPDAARVRLEVVDAAGRLVCILVDENYPAGQHEIAWDGRNRSGRPVASGVYLYRLEAAGRDMTRKMLLLK